MYCDRIYSYLVEQGCLENVGIAIEQVERDVPRPQQLNTTITLRTVLECDYRFDVIPFHKHGQMKETTRIVGVPACGFNATSSKNATKMPGTVCKARHGREDWLHDMPRRQKAPHCQQKKRLVQLAALPAKQLHHLACELKWRIFETKVTSRADAEQESIVDVYQPPRLVVQYIPVVPVLGRRKKGRDGERESGGFQISRLMVLYVGPGF